MLAVISAICVSSCSKDDDDKFDYPLETLLGTWNAKEIYVDGKWYDVTQYPYTKFGMSITFYSNGKFYGSGYFGTGSGTYKTSGKTITTYIDDEVYATYTVNSLASTTADLTMQMGNSSLRMKAVKSK